MLKRMSRHSNIRILTINNIPKHTPYLAIFQSHGPDRFAMLSLFRHVIRHWCECFVTYIQIKTCYGVNAIYKIIVFDNTVLKNRLKLCSSNTH